MGWLDLGILLHVSTEAAAIGGWPALERQDGALGDSGKTGLSWDAGVAGPVPPPHVASSHGFASERPDFHSVGAGKGYMRLCIFTAS